MIEIIPNYHPFFVHFTVALISIAFITSMAGKILPHKTFKKEAIIVSRWCLWLGTAATILTVSAGFYAYYTIAHDEISHAVMKMHRNWALITLGVLLCTCYISIKSYIKKSRASWMYLTSLFVAIFFVLITAWFGGELVYRYGSGVMSLPQQDDHQHSAETAHGTQLSEEDAKTGHH